MRVAIPENVTPDGLLIRANIMRERGDESCARHLELAAEKIATLTENCKHPLDDTDLAAASFSIDSAEEYKEARVVLYSELNQKGAVLAHWVMESPDLYDLAHLLLKLYDKLEGIE